MCHDIFLIIARTGTSVTLVLFPNRNIYLKFRHIFFANAVTKGMIHGETGEGIVISSSTNSSTNSTKIEINYKVKVEKKRKMQKKLN